MNVDLKGGFHLNVVFSPRNVGLIELFRSLFVQFKKPSLITQFYVWDFLEIFGYIWKEIVFLKGLVELGEIRNIKDLM